MKHTEHTRQTIELIINDSKRHEVVERRIDLSDQDLSSLDLSGLNLSGANLRGADLRGANLQDADLRSADLWGANLRGADLQDANLDFTGHELSCRTIGVKVGRRLVSQLLYHMCRMDVLDCPEWDELRNDERVIALANQSHVVNVYGFHEIEPLKAQDEEPKFKSGSSSILSRSSTQFHDIYMNSCFFS